MASAFPLEQLLLIIWQIKNDTLTGYFGFVGNKMAFTIGKSTKIESHFITYKSNENTSYLTTKLMKTVTVNVLKSNYNRIVSDEMVNVVKDSGEGRFFSMQAGARKHRKKLSWSHWQARWVSGFFT
jgi:hypothetical protein